MQQVTERTITDLFGVRAAKVLDVQLVLVEWREIKNIKGSNIQINQVHQFLGSKRYNHLRVDFHFHGFRVRFNPLTPKVKPWVIQSFLTFDSMDRTLKCDYSWESC